MIASWCHWIFGSIGFLVFLVLQLSWCCRINKCGLVTVGVLACGLSLGCAAVAVSLEADADHVVLFSHDIDHDFYHDVWNYNFYAVVAAAAAGALLWAVVGVCTLTFACKRLQKLERRSVRQTTAMQMTMRLERTKADTKTKEDRTTTDCRSKQWESHDHNIEEDMTEFDEDDATEGYGEGSWVSYTSSVV